MNQNIPDNKTIELRNGQLQVVMDQPGNGYRGSRFDWSGFIRQIRYKDNAPLCAPESLVPGLGSGGEGLCSEFGLNHLPAYEACAVGELFPKIGVGWLRRVDDGPRRIIFDYPIEIPADIRTDDLDDEGQPGIRLVSRLPEYHGLSCVSTRTVRLAGNRLIMEIQLENTGSQVIELDEYCHNFLSLDRIGNQGDYDLRLGFDYQGVIQPRGECAIDGRLIRRHADMKGEFYFQLRPAAGQAEPDFIWQLIRQPDGLVMSDVSRLEMDYMAFWGKEHVISPEVFVALKLEPGQTKVWTRQYVFSDKG